MGKWRGKKITFSFLQVIGMLCISKNRMMKEESEMAVVGEIIFKNMAGTSLVSSG